MKKHMKKAKMAVVEMGFNPNPAGAAFLKEFSSPGMIAYLDKAEIIGATMLREDFDRTMLNLIGGKLPKCPCCDDPMPIPDRVELNGVRIIRVDTGCMKGAMALYNAQETYVSSMVLPDCKH